MTTRALATVALLACAVIVDAQSTTSSTVPSDADIRTWLVERVDVQQQSVGMVVGVVEPGGRRVVAYGRLVKDDLRRLDGDTVFEIGSITKVFTSLLLADAVARKEVALTDPIAKYLPSEVRAPERGGRPITLQDLSMHISGLPRLPTNMRPRDASNPYADYSVDQLYQFLSAYQLPRDPGAEYEYSNLGAGLLGHLLALRAATDYESLVGRRITSQLGMTNTGIALSVDMKARFAVGHNQFLRPVPNWDSPTLGGGGALRSTANDLLTFLAAALGYAESPLATALAGMTSVRRPTGMPGLEIALGWHVLTVAESEIVSHSGATAGYRSFIGYNSRARVGVVVLANASSAHVDDLGTHLLLQPSRLPAQRTEVAIDAKLFDNYVGRYQLAPRAIVTVTRDGPRFFVQATGEPQVEIFAEGQKDYFVKVVDVQLTFETDASGEAVAVILHQLGRDLRAPRLTGDK